MKKFTSIMFLCGIMLCAAMGTANAQTSGTTGPLTWSFNTETGTLTITGEGAMPDYVYNTSEGEVPPWLIGYQITIATVVIGDGVTSIGNRAFHSCVNLTSITIPSSVTSIGEYAFSYCSGLTSFIIGSSVTSIGEYAFSYCSGLTSFIIGSSVTSIGDYAFEGCSSLSSIEVASGNPNYSSEGGVLFNRDKTTLVLCPEGKAGAYTIPNSVITIGDAAFNNCSKLTSVTIGNSVTSIGEIAFWVCQGLTSINVTSANPNYSSENGVLFNKDKTTLILCPQGKSGAYTVPNPVTTIGNNAFRGCSKLTSVTIGNSVTTIRDSAFEYCSGLTSIEVASANPSYSSENGVLFNKNKTTLIKYPIGKTKTTYTIPNSVITIEQSAFAYCSGLTSIIISNSVTTIEDNVFRGCSNLTSVIIGNSVTTIGDYAFIFCSGLTSIDIPNSVITVGYQAFGGCSGMTSLTIGNSVTTIETAFIACSSLTSVTIPNSVTTIGISTFYNCSGLTSVTIGNSVTSIGICAFGNCTSLTEVINYATTPQVINDTVFLNVDKSTCTLRVPEGSLEAYRTADVWKDFGTIEGITADINTNTLTSITVYSNGNSISIGNNSGVALKKIQITDMQGRIVYDGKASNSVTIPVNGANGIYIVRLISDDGKVLSTKVHLTR